MYSPHDLHCSRTAKAATQISPEITNNIPLFLSTLFRWLTHLRMLRLKVKDKTSPTSPTCMFAELNVLTRHMGRQDIYISATLTLCDKLWTEWSIPLKENEEQFMTCKSIVLGRLSNYWERIGSWQSITICTATQSKGKRDFPKFLKSPKASKI